MAADAGLKVWSVTADGTSVNLSTFEQLRCQFDTTYDTFQTKLQHPTTGEGVFIIADPSHMLKLARNASTIQLANQMFLIPNDLFTYLLTCKYFQDHLNFCSPAFGLEADVTKILTACSSSMPCAK